MLLEKLTLLLEEKGYLKNPETGKIEPGSLDVALKKYFDKILKDLNKEDLDEVVQDKSQYEKYLEEIIKYASDTYSGEPVIDYIKNNKSRLITRLMSVDTLSESIDRDDEFEGDQLDEGWKEALVGLGLAAATIAGIGKAYVPSPEALADKEQAELVVNAQQDALEKTSDEEVNQIVSALEDAGIQIRGTYIRIPPSMWDKYRGNEKELNKIINQEQRKVIQKLMVKGNDMVKSGFVITSTGTLQWANPSQITPINEIQEEDPIDTITMDVPLFIRLLEYAREDAENDMDLHDVAEKAIAGTKQQGILSMDDYDMLVGDSEQINTSEIAKEIYETIQLGKQLNEAELCQRGKDYIAARKRAGEKSSAYLSGRAVRVCKGDIEFKGKKQKDFKG